MNRFAFNPWSIAQRSAAPLTTVLLLLLPVLHAPAQSPPAARPATGVRDPLSATPWSESSYGLMLRPPEGAHLQTSNADAALLRIGLPGSGTMTLRVRTAQKDASMPSVLKEAIKQFAMLYPGATILPGSTILDQERDGLKINGRTGGLLYMLTPKDKDRAWVVGQALVQIDPVTFAVLELMVPHEDFAQIRPVFEGVFKSIDLTDPAKLNDERKKWLESGANWHKTIDAAALKKVLVPEQLLRIVTNGRDVGYVKVTEGRGKHLSIDGTRIDILYHIQVGAQASDTVSFFFLSDDAKQEIWSIRTTSQPLGPTPPGKAIQPLTWVETGSRSDTSITVSCQGPGRVVSNNAWDLRDLGPAARAAYLSQVEVYLLDRLLPHQTAADLGFYAYYPKSSKLTMRCDHIVPRAGGAYDIFSRPGLDQGEQQTRRDASGQLIDRIVGEGQVIKPTTAAELEAIWKVK